MTYTDADMISRTSFARLVQLHARMSGHDPDERDLDNWLAAAWSRVVEDMNPARWAAEYLDALAGAAR